MLKQMTTIIFQQQMSFGKLQIPKVVQQNLTDFVKLYVKFGPDYTRISKDFEQIVEQKISTKFIAQFFFQLNKKVYALIVDYLQKHKDQKGESQIAYNNLWPLVIDDGELRSQIQNIPRNIFKSLNKDVSEAYNLLIESLKDTSLQKLFKYQRIRDLYQFMTEISLQKKSKGKKDVSRQIIQKRTLSRTLKSTEKQTKQKQQNQILFHSGWTLTQERYLCALFLERPLFKCCQKLSQKFGENEKWNTSQKIYKKVEQIFQKSFKKALRSILKHLSKELQMKKQNLINQVMKKKSNNLEKSVLRFYKYNDDKKKSKCLSQISEQIHAILKKTNTIKSEKMNETTLKVQNTIKEEVLPIKTDDFQTIELEKSDFTKISDQNETEVKIQTVEDEKDLSSQSKFLNCQILGIK